MRAQIPPVSHLLNSDQQPPISNLEHRYAIAQRHIALTMFQIADRRLLIAVEEGHTIPRVRD